MSKDQGKRKRGVGSMLLDETEGMERKRRLMEQDGERRFARVRERDHATQEARQEVLNDTLGLEESGGPLEHPRLNTQLYDGREPPPVDRVARMNYENEIREQEKEKQLRMGNMPSFSNTPRPERH